MGINEEEKGKDTEQISERDKLLELAVNLTEETVDKFVDFCMKINTHLLPHFDNHPGSFKDREKFKNVYGPFIANLLNKDQGVCDYITLADGHHRLFFEIDRDDPEVNSVTLAQSGLDPDLEVLESWKALGKV